MNSLIWIAVFLFALWLVVRIFFALTSLVFHALWIVGLVLLAFWLARKFF
ncbi:MAG: hypothetical protein ABIR71_10020 [Chthoniobacterales bacterium]